MSVEALEDDASGGEEGLVLLGVEGDVPLAERGDGIGNVVGDAVSTIVVFGELGAARCERLAREADGDQNGGRADRRA